MSFNIVWFRDDLRVHDHPALACAMSQGLPVVGLYILDETSSGLRPMGEASRWWLAGALRSLHSALRDIGVPLILRRGSALDSLKQLQKEVNISGIFWSRRYSHAETSIDRSVKDHFRESSVPAQSFSANLLHDPWALLTSSRTHYKRFTPFWNALKALGPPRQPLPRPSPLRDVSCHIQSEMLDDWSLEPVSPNWAIGMERVWDRSETGAMRALHVFLKEKLHHYASSRDFPSRETTSTLSPYLRFGQISPFQIFQSLEYETAPVRDIEKFRAELAWREFSYHLLYHHGELHHENIQKTFDSFSWVSNASGLYSWQKGLTGYPIVDAGMRQLWTTGFMHNRVRMITASFLAKHLMIDWREGERWFWDTLVDADPANNPASWQWVSGCGADAAPFFRIFNPILQGEKFDPDGHYIRQYIDELKLMPASHIHKPWLAPAAVLENAGVTLGKNYPFPCVPHAEARRRALRAYHDMRGNSDE